MKDNIKKIIITLISLLMILVIMYFIIHPLFFKNINSIFVHKLNDLESARNYYTIIAAISTTISGFLGLTLGLFYYLNKKDNDERQSSLERKRSRINIIIKELNRYDELVDEIISKRKTSKDDLCRIRHKISRCPEIINTILDNNDILLNFSGHDIENILKLFSFVEQSEHIMEDIDEEYINFDSAEIKHRYIDLIQEARKICYLKTE